MASIHEEIEIDTEVARAWDAIRDVGALHTRLVPGFVTDCKLEGDVRTVTFGNGMVVREPIISIDEARRRVAWTSIGGRTTHYNASVTALENSGKTRVTWVVDLLPNELAPAIEGMVRTGLLAMKRTLEKR